MTELKGQLARFLVAGFSAVGTDLLVYYGLFPLVGNDLGKALSFIAGSIVAYLINKFWTFRSSEKPSKNEVIRFCTLYASTLVANITVNFISLAIFPSWVLLAFLAATGTSTVLNFIGMKFWVFQNNTEN